MTRLLASIIFNAVHHVVFSGMRLAVALDAIHMGASAAAVGTIMAMFAFLPALGSVLMGRLIDRKGSRVPLLVCSPLLVASPLLLVLFANLYTLAIAAMLTGAAFVTLSAINQQVVGRLSKPQDRPGNFAIASTWLAVSATISPALTGLLIDQIGFRWTYVFLGALPVFAMLFFLRKLPYLEERAPSAKGAMASGNVIGLVREPNLRRIYLLNIMFATGWDVFLFMTPIYGASLNFSASQIGIIIACFSVAAFVVRLLTRLVTRHFTPWQVLLLSLLVSGISSLAFGLSNNTPLLMLFAFAMGLGYGLASPMTNTLLYEASPPSRVAEVLGLRSSVTMSLQMAIPLMAGALGALIGIAPLFWLLAAMQLGGAYSARSNWGRESDRPR